jgi:hypothetical protein
VLKVPTLLLTNGLQHYVVATDPAKPIEVLKAIPNYQSH